MLDKRLLILLNYMEKHEPDMSSLAQLLNVSQRQLTRILKKWHDNGWIEYKHGLGRGNTMSITLLVPVEQDLFFEVVNNKAQLTLTEINNYLNLPWSSSVRSSLNDILLTQFHEMIELTMMDFIYKIPPVIHPALHLDLPNVQLALHTMETLYIIQEDGTLASNIVRYEEWHDNELHLYLKEGIQYTDFSVLDAKDIKYVIEFLKYESEFQYLFRHVGPIKIYDQTHLSISYTYQLAYLKYLLSEPFSSIYKINEHQQLIGTGPYFIADKTEDRIILKSNPAYHEQLPDIRTIYLFIGDLINRSRLQRYEISEVKTMYWGNEYIIFNPLNNNFNLKERRYLALLIRRIVYQAMPTPEGIHEWLFEVPKYIEHIDLKKPLRILIDMKFSEGILELAHHLEQEGIVIELIKLEHEDFLAQDIGLIDADLVWMHEYYHQVQPLKSFSLLTYCKFKEWFQPLPLAQSVLNADFNNTYAEDFIEKIISEYYFIPLFKRYRSIYVPSGLGYLKTRHYSTIHYHKIIKMD